MSLDSLRKAYRAHKKRSNQHILACAAASAKALREANSRASVAMSLIQQGLSVDEVALQIGVHRTTINKYLREKGL